MKTKIVIVAVMFLLAGVVNAHAQSYHRTIRTTHYAVRGWSHYHHSPHAYTTRVVYARPHAYYRPHPVYYRPYRRVVYVRPHHHYYHPYHRRSAHVSVYLR